ncbi:YybH family protein, partial [Pseudomonas aeruginosa]|uniref:YybH family protein n=1 Tax=Pseudomonas aeruginosa TaxID=287 RepID=UPI00396826E4
PGDHAFPAWRSACTSRSETMTFDIAELQIHADQQVAFAHYLCHCGGTGPDGKPHSSWMRVSAGYRKQGDGWKVIHEHFSAPFDMDGKALFDLQP